MVADFFFYLLPFDPTGRPRMLAVKARTQNAHATHSRLGGLDRSAL